MATWRPPGSNDGTGEEDAYQSGPLNPARLLALAERVGRHDWSPLSGGDDEASVASMLAWVRQAVRADPARFLHELVEICLPAGGWPAYGADRLALRLLGPDHPLRTSPDRQALLDAALDVARAGLVPFHLLPRYQAERFVAHGTEPDQWLPFCEAPPLGDAAITPLGPNEVRRVLEGRAGTGITVTVRRSGNRMVGLLELPTSGRSSHAAGTATRAQIECWQADDLYDLYQDIAWGFPFRSWADPELEPFFAGPAPQF